MARDGADPGGSASGGRIRTGGAGDGRAGTEWTRHGPARAGRLGTGGGNGLGPGRTAGSGAVGPNGLATGDRDGPAGWTAAVRPGRTGGLGADGQGFDRWQARAGTWSSAEEPDGLGRRAPRQATERPSGQSPGMVPLNAEGCRSWKPRDWRGVAGDVASSETRVERPRHGQDVPTETLAGAGTGNPELRLTAGPRGGTQGLPGGAGRARWPSSESAEGGSGNPGVAVVGPTRRKSPRLAGAARSRAIPRRRIGPGPVKPMTRSTCPGRTPSALDKKLKIEVPMEIDVSCGPNGVVLHPGGYRISPERLKEQGAILAKELRSIVRLRQAGGPHDPAPAVDRVPGRAGGLRDVPRGASADRDLGPRLAGFAPGGRHQGPRLLPRGAGSDA